MTPRVSPPPPGAPSPARHSSWLSRKAGWRLGKAGEGLGMCVAQGPGQNGSQARPGLADAASLMAVSCPTEVLSTLPPSSCPTAPTDLDKQGILPSRSPRFTGMGGGCHWDIKAQGCLPGRLHLGPQGQGEGRQKGTRRWNTGQTFPRGSPGPTLLLSVRSESRLVPGAHCHVFNNSVQCRSFSCLSL